MLPVEKEYIKKFIVWYTSISIFAISLFYLLTHLDI